MANSVSSFPNGPGMTEVRPEGEPPPKVSVHIITYNQEELVRESIESALAQDYPNLEIVVADDASTDGTPAVLAGYQQAHPGRVRAILGDRNLGVTGNSNRALHASSSDFIAFMGGDDLLLPGKISAQVEWFAKSPRRVLCAHQVEVFYDDGSSAPYPLTRRLIRGKGAEGIIRHQPFGATSVMVRADRIPAHGFREDLPVVSDTMMWIEVLGQDGEYGYLPQTFARYRRHSANVTNQPLKNIGDVDRHFEILEKEFPEFRRATYYGKTRRLYYDIGVTMMAAGLNREARRRFFDAIKREPWFLRAWVRLAQSFA